MKIVIKLKDDTYFNNEKLKHNFEIVLKNLIYYFDSETALYIANDFKEKNLLFEEIDMSSILDIYFKIASDEILDLFFNLKYNYLFIKLAKCGYNLDKIYNSINGNVYSAIIVEFVRNGYRMDEFLDSHWICGTEMARNCYALDELIKLGNHYINIELVKQGYRLDEFIDFSDYNIRRELVKVGYKLDKLSNDMDYRVRAECILQGYNVTKIFKENDYQVINYLKETGYSIKYEIGGETIDLLKTDFQRLNFI